MGKSKIIIIVLLVLFSSCGGKKTEFIESNTMDLILIKNDLSKLSHVHKLSKKMLKITYQNIIFAIFVVVALVVLNFLGKMDITFGVILHEGSTLAVILNSLRMLKEIKE